ncbi:MAG: hypothetical protein ACRD6W_06515 [Nitrososphaerales archaeon]
MLTLMLVLILVAIGLGVVGYVVAIIREHRSLRLWIGEEVVSLLKNDETSVARYAHEALDAVHELTADFQSLHQEMRDSNKILADHISRH